jgi:hypothetical protein
MRERGLKNRELAKLIGRSPGAVGAALSAAPAKNSQTLRDIFNYLFPPAAEAALIGHASQLAERSPETAALLSAVFRDLADLLVNPSEGTSPASDRMRN